LPKAETLQIYAQSAEEDKIVTISAPNPAYAHHPETDMPITVLDELVHITLVRDWWSPQQPFYQSAAIQVTQQGSPVLPPFTSFLSAEISSLAPWPSFLLQTFLFSVHE
jgi:hypothetical protein